MIDYQQWLEGTRESLDYKTEEAKLDFVHVVFDAMKAQGFNQAELARRLGCSRAWVGQLLSANANPTLGTMVKLAETLGGSLKVRLKLPETRRASDGTVRLPRALAAKEEAMPDPRATVAGRASRPPEL